jgi:hypothetical protein
MSEQFLNLTEKSYKQREMYAPNTRVHITTHFPRLIQSTPTHQ